MDRQIGKEDQRSLQCCYCGRKRFRVTCLPARLPAGGQAGRSIRLGGGAANSSAGGSLSTEAPASGSQPGRWALTWMSLYGIRHSKPGWGVRPIRLNTVGRTGDAVANRIRKQFRDEIEVLKPLMHDTYRAIGRYQKSRNERNERRVRDLIGRAGAELLFFKPFLQHKKQAYFDAVLAEELSLSDRIIALDTAVGFMHIDFPVSRAYAHRESEALRRALEEAREHPADSRNEDRESNDLVLHGLPASPGRAAGAARVVLHEKDYGRVAAASVVVARMTRPDLVVAGERAAAIVTDAGGMLCHAAIVAREWGIPCVVGTRTATSRIEDGQTVIVDGTQGSVTLVQKRDRL